MKWLPAFFFSLTLLAGIWCFGDYGISWDEPIQRELGNFNWNYVLHGDTSWFANPNSIYGPFVEMIEVLPEYLFHLHDDKTIYLSRHAVNFFIFWLGTVFFYLLAGEVFLSAKQRDVVLSMNKRKWWFARISEPPEYSNIVALLPVLLLYLTPRFFAQAFYNSKDLPFLSLFVIAAWCLVRFLKQPGLIRAALLALVTGMLIATRVLGVLIPAMLLGFGFMQFLFGGNKSISKMQVLFSAVYLAFLIPCTILFYPLLWHDPVDGFIRCFSTFSHFPYDDPQLFMGQLLVPQHLPWYYIPVWMGITIPLLWQLFFAVGLPVTLVQIFSGKVVLTRSWHFILLAWLMLPYLAILILHSAVYDEWRHLFFIYPAFLLICVEGIRWLWNWGRGNKHWRIMLPAIITASILVQSASVLGFCYRNHPFEQVYFTCLAGKDIPQRFDLDYWGLSYRRGLEYLVSHAKERPIKACWQNAPGNYNLMMLDPKDRQLIKEVPFDSAQYFLTNFRFHPEQYVDSAWKVIPVEGLNILAVEHLNAH